MGEVKVKRDSIFKKWVKFLGSLILLGGLYDLLLSSIININFSLLRGMMIVLLINLTVSMVKTFDKVGDKDD